MFEGDFWGKSVAEFSHSLGQEQSFADGGDRLLRALRNDMTNCRVELGKRTVEDSVLSGALYAFITSRKHCTGSALVGVEKIESTIILILHSIDDMHFEGHKISLNESV